MHEINPLPKFIAVKKEGCQFTEFGIRVGFSSCIFEFSLNIVLGLIRPRVSTSKRFFFFSTVTL